MAYVWHLYCTMTVHDGAFKKESMTLKIQRSAEGEVVAFTLSGRIEGDQVAELQWRFYAKWGRKHSSSPVLRCW